MIGCHEEKDCCTHSGKWSRKKFMCMLKQVNLLHPSSVAEHNILSILYILNRTIYIILDK